MLRFLRSRANAPACAHSFSLLLCIILDKHHSFGARIPVCTRPHLLLYQICISWTVANHALPNADMLARRGKLGQLTLEFDRAPSLICSSVLSHPRLDFARNLTPLIPCHPRAKCVIPTAGSRQDCGPVASGHTDRGNRCNLGFHTLWAKSNTRSQRLRYAHPHFSSSASRRPSLCLLSIHPYGRRMLGAYPCP
jgi:hypothetical protein